MGNADERKEALEKLMSMRAELAISHAFSGIKIDEDKALQLLKNRDDNNISELDKAIRDRLVAAVDNLSEFAVCEEYQLYQDIVEIDADAEEEGVDFDNEGLVDEYYARCKKYNDEYALVENEDIEYALEIAGQYAELSKDTIITYFTQNDDRVRPWHFALQGFSAKRDDFPAWMIPPIEWACRCYLIASDDVRGSVQASGLDIQKVYAKTPKKPKELDDVFSESVARCGRIFGKSHRYFKVKKKDKKWLSEVVERIRSEYYGK